MQLFHAPSLNNNQKNITFNKEESKHIIKVLRKNIGDLIMVTNGSGTLFKTQITATNPNRCEADIIHIEIQKKRPSNLHIAIAPTKQIDRFEWFLEKATEIGIEEITPIICHRSERKQIKTERLQKILEAAMKQSLQTFLPKLNTEVNFKDFLKQDFQGVHLIAHCENTLKQNIKDVLKPNVHCTILIGPEGDFTPDEITLALQNNFTPITLGINRLRTETAAVLSCSAVAIINE